VAPDYRRALRPCQAAALSRAGRPCYLCRHDLIRSPGHGLAQLRTRRQASCARSPWRTRLDQIVASRPDTLTARLRRRFPRRYARKDARTLALRLAYGQQSKLTTEVTAGPAGRLAAAELERARAPAAGAGADRLRQGALPAHPGGLRSQPGVADGGIGAQPIPSTATMSASASRWRSALRGA
jgi:hypothetical protein